MSDKSPLFVSALELLAHATELYASGHPRKYKFVVLHLANSVELLLKDCLIDNGITIYKNPKETITIWGSFDELEKLGIKIPEKPVIELLVDDRNTIQHRFGFPNAESVFYYLEQVVNFFNRFLDERYKVKLVEALTPHLTKENLALIGLVEDDYSHLKKLFQLSPEAAVQQAYAMVEAKLREKIPYEKLRSPSTRPLFANDIIRLMAKKDIISIEIAREFERFRMIRNQAAHGASDKVSKAELEAALKSAMSVLEILDKINPVEIFDSDESAVSKA
jgi:HEPN domain-containing protein